MKKANFVVLIDADYLRNQEVCETGNVEDADAWVDISVHGYLDTVEWDEDDVDGLLDFVAKDNELLSTDILFAIKM